METFLWCFARSQHTVGSAKYPVPVSTLSGLETLCKLLKGAASPLDPDG